MGGTEISFPDAACDMAFLHTYWDNSRWRWAVQIKDRRWRWQHGSLTGQYNVRLGDGTVQQASRKSAAELAGIILDALGEVGYDVSRVPQNVYPPANWLGISPALALQELCDYVACEVVLGLDNRVTIWPAGVGADAGDSDAMRHQRFRLKPRRVPQRILLVGGPDVYQSKFLLESIGREEDGDHKLYADLDYLPDDMNNESPWSLPSVTDDEERAAAFETVYRYFRAKQLAQGGMTPQGCPVAVTKISQLLPFQPRLIETFRDREDIERSSRPYLSGNFWGYGDTPENVSNVRYLGEWTLLGDWGVVTTAKPVLYLDGSYQFSDPTLYLTVTFNVRDANGEFARLVRQGFAEGSGDLVLDRPELFQAFQTVYDDTTPIGLATNQPAVLAEADAYVALFQQKFADPWSYERKYGGLVPINPDGKIAQVKWSCHANQGWRALTHVGVNEEFDVHNLSAKQRRAYATA
jgi:hypothetical protein